MKIAVYGIGVGAETILDCLPFLSGVEVSCFVVTRPETEGFHCYKVVGPDALESIDFDYLVISTDIYYNEIVQGLRGLPFYSKLENRIIGRTQWLESVCNRLDENGPIRSIRVEGGTRVLL